MTPRRWVSFLFQMARDEFRHLKHRDLTFTSEDWLELVIGYDISFIRRILKIIFFDIYPHLLDYLSSGHWAFADNDLEFWCQVHRLHKGWISYSDHKFNIINYLIDLTLGVYHR